MKRGSRGEGVVGVGGSFVKQVGRTGMVKANIVSYGTPYVTLRVFVRIGEAVL